MKLSVRLLPIMMILLSEYDQLSDLWQQLELAFALKPDFWGTTDWDRNWFNDFYAGKTQLASFGQSHISSAIDVTMNGFVYLKCWDYLSLLNCIGALTLSILPKLPSSK